MEKRICLNGFWDFTTDISMDAGGSADWPEEWKNITKEDGQKIHVPSPYNINGFSGGRTKEIAGESFYIRGGDFCLYPEYPKAWENAGCGAYRRTFFVPEESREKRIFLLFDAVAYHSRFFVNGKCMREEVEAFLPIEIEITEVVRFGEENEIVVIAENSQGYMYKDEKNWNRIDYPKGSFWGEYVAGIWQDVWYVERPDTYLADVFVTTDIWNGTLTAKFELDGKAADKARIRFTLIDPESRETLRLGECDASQKSFEWNFGGIPVKLWDIDNPALYCLQTQFLEQDQVRDTKTVRFGFRSFTARGERFYLNKRPLNLKNDSWHYMGYSVQTPEYARSYYRMAKDAGVNIIRLHAQPFPSFFYDIADEMGMLLVSESAVWASHCNFSYNDAFFENSRRHLIRLVLRDRNHPSVVLWSPENECIPAYRYCGSKYIEDEADLERKLYEFLKVIYEYDTSRLVSCDGSGDLGGRLAVHSLHYPGFDCPAGRGKPITIGEMGSMYYSTPDMVCMEMGQETLKSADARLRAVGEDAYRNLMGERRWASQICVFNLIWYGLEPIPFRDRLLDYEDYTTPGIKPRRITPYLRTLNAGGDDGLPEYIPNPVWELTRKAYLPVRSYIDRMPRQVYAGTSSVLPLFLFYDEREDGAITFSVILEADGKTAEKQETVFEMKACDPIETTVSIQWPEEEGEVSCRTSVAVRGKTVFEESYTVEILEESRLVREWEALRIPCVRMGDNTADGSGIFCRKTEKQGQTRKLRKIFCAGKEFSFAKPFAAGREEDGDVPGKALCFDGSGQPAAWYVEEGGSQRIVTDLDLTCPAEPAHWLLLTWMGNYLKRQRTEKAKNIVFYGKEDSPYADILRKLRCGYERVDADALLRMLSRKQDKILFADGGMDLSVLSHISRNNFETVVVAGLTGMEPEWYTEFEVTGKKTFQAYPTDAAVEKFGVYGAGLYGLTVGEECVIGGRLLEYRREPGEGNIFWKVPDIDWRMWNNNPEQLKTVSLHRSEQTDHHRLSVLSLHHRGESDVWINQLTPDADHPKRRSLWRNFLAGIGAGYGDTDMDKTQKESVYEGRLRRLWMEEEERVVTEKEKLGENVRVGCLIVSPQDRTDFLYNPDVIHMRVRAAETLSVYLNGELLGEGTDLRFTSICLKAGENRMILVSSKEQDFPEIVFERANQKELDLDFYTLHA